MKRTQEGLGPGAGMLAIALAVVGCDSLLPSRDCTDMGYFNSATLWLEPSPVDLSRYTYRLETAGPEGVPRSCVRWASDTPVPGSPLADLPVCGEGWEDGVELIREGNRAGIQLRWDSGRWTKWLKYEIWADQKLAASGKVDFRYERDEPNGEGCGDRYTAEATINVDLPVVHDATGP